MRTFKLVAAIAIALAGVGGGMARASGTADGVVSVGDPIFIDKTRDLDFGNIVPGPLGGTVLMSTGDVRTFTGDLAPGIPANEGAAVFLVTGVPGASYSIVLPSPFNLEGAGDDMLVDGIASTPGGSGTLGVGGDQSFGVGGTLHVGANQLPGTYSQSFGVTVAYN
jgi:spore coat protein U-like protein